MTASKTNAFRKRSKSRGKRSKYRSGGSLGARVHKAIATLLKTVLRKSAAKKKKVTRRSRKASS